MRALALQPPPEQEPLTRLFELLDHDEETLAELVRCLQEERASITTFDLSELLSVVARKSKLLEVFYGESLHRRQFFQDLWNDLDREDPLPEDVPAFLRALAPLFPDSREELLDRASRLQSLLEVMMELHEVNADLVERSLSWMEAYVSTLMVRRPADAYNAGGQAVYLSAARRR